MIACSRGFRERRQLIGDHESSTSNFDNLAGWSPRHRGRCAGPLIDKRAKLLNPSQISGTVQPAIEAGNRLKGQRAFS